MCVGVTLIRDRQAPNKNISSGELGAGQLHVPGSTNDLTSGADSITPAPPVR